MRPAAPSLDMIAAAQNGAALNEQQQESRSSSSTNSPAPADNEESDFFLVANDSQSSLGVPNLQDMQVNDPDEEGSDEADECQPAVHHLPSEILISIFSKLSSTSDLFHCMLTCRRWAKNTVDLLWHRPACTTWKNHESICHTLKAEHPFFVYRDFIKRLNLANLADTLNDGSVLPLTVCKRLERLTLTNCKNLSDLGVTALVEHCSSLLALDVSGDENVTDRSILAAAEHCRKLQGLNITGCRQITNESMIRLAESCRYIKRLKVNDCVQLRDEAILAFAENCPNILEIDLHQCREIGNEPITALLAKGHSLRELRLANCELIDDGAFLFLPPNRTYEHLRILDLTSCVRLTDVAVQKIIEVAPRLRNLVLAKCRHITDMAVHSIAKLGKNLHYVHLGHCSLITDEAVKRLVQACNRIRYIDLGCCTNLTDDSVTRLATLPKLKRIGLVKCSSITDESVMALARANHRPRARRDAHGNVSEDYYASSLERVHLSYCTNLSLKSIMRLLNYCPRLTHLSLTGVGAFLRDEFHAFCRPPPPDFNDHQRTVFCVFSGNGVSRLRDYLNTSAEYESLRETHRRLPPLSLTRRPGARMAPSQGALIGGIPGQHPVLGATDGEFDEQDAPEDDDGDDGLEASDMALDAQQLPDHQQGALLQTPQFAAVMPHQARPLVQGMALPGPNTHASSQPLVMDWGSFQHTSPPRPDRPQFMVLGASSAGGNAGRGQPASVAGLGLGLGPQRPFDGSSAASAASVAGSSRAPDQHDLDEPAN